LGYQSTDYALAVRDLTWTSFEVPEEFDRVDNGDHSFRFLGVKMDISNTAKKQLHFLQDNTRMAATVANHQFASPDNTAMASKVETHRKVAFPGKLSPWSLRDL